MMPVNTNFAHSVGTLAILVNASFHYYQFVPSIYTSDEEAKANAIGVNGEAMGCYRSKE